MESHRRLNPSTGGFQSRKLPQKEFDKQPHLNSPPLPQSESYPVSLGKKEVFFCLKS